jgi:hypothetical protein
MRHRLPRARSTRASERAAPERTPHAEVLRLQRMAGNAATTRLVGQARRSLARFGEPEHKAIGDAALKRRWRLPGSALFKELELTFGDWIALGDWFENVGDVKRIMRGEPLEGEEKVGIVKPDKSGNRPDTIGQLYYAVLVKIRPKTEHERKTVEDAYMGTLFTEVDKAAVEERYGRLKTRNIKHFPNPLVGDTELTTAQKATRRRDGKPFGAIAQYRADHLDAIGLAISAGQLGDDRLLGEAVAMDGFACHYLTDAFSASHTRTPRSSIETYWDAKVPKFDDRLVKWLADEVALAVNRSPSGLLEWLGVTIGAPFNLVRSKAREKIRPVVPQLSFGDVVGLVVHDWEGAHGPNRHGPLVEVAGARFRTVGDDALLPVIGKFQAFKSDRALTAMLKNPKEHDAERTFAGATLAVRASVEDLDRAFALAHKNRKRPRKDIIASLMGKDGLFASERYIPKAVPDAKQPEDDRMPKWDYATVDELLHDPKISAALPESAKKVAEPFEDTIKHLDASQAVKDQITRAVVRPLKSGDRERIREWIKSVIEYSPVRLRQRMRSLPTTEPREDLVRLRQEVH